MSKKRNRPDESFFQSDVTHDRAVIDWNGEGYKPLEEVEGTQPYYTYQGIGITQANTSTTFIHKKS